MHSLYALQVGGLGSPEAPRRNPAAFDVSLHGNAADVERFATLGLDAKWSGYTATADILEAEFKEMRGRYMALQVNFRSTKAVREPTLLLVHLALNPRAYYRLQFWDHPSGRV